MELGDRLNSLRRKSGKSLQQVADAVGISKAHIWEMEKGRSRNPSFELMQKLAAHFGVPVTVLVGESEEAGRGRSADRAHPSRPEGLGARDRQLIEEMVKGMVQRPDASG